MKENLAGMVTENSAGLGPRGNPVQDLWDMKNHR